MLPACVKQACSIAAQWLIGSHIPQPHPVVGVGERPEGSVWAEFQAGDRLGKAD
jgi:hypothetical protein